MITSSLLCDDDVITERPTARPFQLEVYAWKSKKSVKHSAASSAVGKLASKVPRAAPTVSATAMQC
jgi:hypothetical protein